MKENNIEIIKNAQKEAKTYLKTLNKFFVKDLHLEQDRSDPEFTFYWYNNDTLIADIGIDSDEGILLVLIDASNFDKRMDLIVNNHVEFLEEYEGERLMCIEIYSQSDVDLVKELATTYLGKVKCA